MDSLSRDELKTRMDDAFRFGEGTDRFDNNWKIFESFVFGGINYLYERFKDVKNREDALNVMNGIIPKTELLDITDSD